MTGWGFFVWTVVTVAAAVLLAFAYVALKPILVYIVGFLALFVGLYLALLSLGGLISAISG